MKWICAPAFICALAFVGALALVASCESSSAVDDQSNSYVAGDVPADQNSWMDTEVEVEPGGTLEITASGDVSLDDSGEMTGPNGFVPEGECGEDCPMPTAPSGALIGQIGLDSTKFLVGADYKKIMSRSGTLYLKVNDDDANDNDGEFHVKIVYTPPEDQKADGEIFADNEKWLNTEIVVQEGGTLRIIADGKITIEEDGDEIGPDGDKNEDECGEECPMPEASPGALIAQIDLNSEKFLIGSDYESVVDNTGILYLKVNDDTMDDNSGRFRVWIFFEPSASGDDDDSDDDDDDDTSD